MKVIKPQKLGLLRRTFEHNRQPYLVTTVLAFFDFESRALLPEVGLWKLAADELAKDAALDLGMPKAHPELVMTAKGYAPDGVPCRAFNVRAQMGAIDKTLYVFGDRQWSWGVPSDRQLITEMALTWENAFGGPDYRLNPVGKGASAPKERARRISFPTSRIRSGSSCCPSTGRLPPDLAATNSKWPQRFDKLGTYGRVSLPNHPTLVSARHGGRSGPSRAHRLRREEEHDPPRPQRARHGAAAREGGR
jgi:Uncharacterized protein conserved in bacteria (DUF2169)